MDITDVATDPVPVLPKPPAGQTPTFGAITRLLTYFRWRVNFAVTIVGAASAFIELITRLDLGIILCVVCVCIVLFVQVELF